MKLYLWALGFIFVVACGDAAYCSYDPDSDSDMEECFFPRGFYMERDHVLVAETDVMDMPTQLKIAQERASDAEARLDELSRRFAESEISSKKMIAHYEERDNQQRLEIARLNELLRRKIKKEKLTQKMLASNEADFRALQELVEISKYKVACLGQENDLLKKEVAASDRDVPAGNNSVALISRGGLKKSHSVGTFNIFNLDDDE